MKLNITTPYLIDNANDDNQADTPKIVTNSISTNVFVSLKLHSIKTELKTILIILHSLLIKSNALKV